MNRQARGAVPLQLQASGPEIRPYRDFQVTASHAITHGDADVGNQSSKGACRKQPARAPFYDKALAASMQLEGAADSDAYSLDKVKRHLLRDWRPEYEPEAFLPPHELRGDFTVSERATLIQLNDIIVDSVMYRKTKVVCTLGPACATEDGVASLLDAGLNIARLNFSHGDHEAHFKTLKLFRCAQCVSATRKCRYVCVCYFLDGRRHGALRAGTPATPKACGVLCCWTPRAQRYGQRCCGRARTSSWRRGSPSSSRLLGMPTPPLKASKMRPRPASASRTPSSASLLPQAITFSSQMGRFRSRWWTSCQAQS